MDKRFFECRKTYMSWKLNETELLVSFKFSIDQNEIYNFGFVYANH